MTHIDLALLSNVITEYLTVNFTGGSLHIVLEDGNWNKSSLEFCLKQAEEEKDYIGVAICRSLLDMPSSFIELCQDVDYLSACQNWKSQKD